MLLTFGERWGRETMLLRDGEEQEGGRCCCTVILVRCYVVICVAIGDVCCNALWHLVLLGGIMCAAQWYLVGAVQEYLFTDEA